MEIFVIVLIIIVLAIIGIVLVVNYNKIQDAMIKISEAQENIDILLNKKIELITNINNIIESKNKNKKIDILEYNKDVKLNDK